MNQTKTRSLLSLVLRQLLLVGTFGILDVWLRYRTQAIGLYDITELAPNLLTLLWAVLLSSVVTLIPSRKWGRIAYGICYYFYMIYTIVQFGVYLVLDRFVYVTDLFLAAKARTTPTGCWNSSPPASSASFWLWWASAYWAFFSSPKSRSCPKEPPWSGALPP